MGEGDGSQESGVRRKTRQMPIHVQNSLVKPSPIETPLQTTVRANSLIFFTEARISPDSNGAELRHLHKHSTIRLCRPRSQAKTTEGSRGGTETRRKSDRLFNLSARIIPYHSAY